jgi:predicted ATP-grasp superfamily ATP-dependent carboligase
MTRQMAAQIDIPVVPGRCLDADDNARNLTAHYGLPLVIKPRRSYWPDRLDGWGKVFIIKSEQELSKVLARVPDRTRYLVEGYFQGVGVGVSVLAEKGKILHSFQHRRLREGKGGPSSYRISEAINPDLYDACEKICGQTKLTGVCMFEFRFNLQSQKWVLLETNARFWGSSPLPLSLGVDFPLYLYDLLLKGAHHPPVQYAHGVRSRNVVLDGLNLVASLRGLHWNEIGDWVVELGRFLMQPIGWLTGRERSDSFVLDDMRPAFAECAVLLRDIRYKFARRCKDHLGRRRSEQGA